MPKLSTYKQTLGHYGKSSGEAKKIQSDMIMEQTWDRDISAKVAYLYDCKHDDEPTKLRNLNSNKSSLKIPIDIKYLVNGSQTFDKDPITYHIQFKPSQECNVPYYTEYFEERYDSIFPLGLYIDIPDSKGKYNRWLVVDKANYYDPQFPTFEILSCDKVFHWIFEGNKYQMAGVLRSQNS